MVLFLIENVGKNNLINILEKAVKRTYVQKQVGFSTLSIPLSPVIMIERELLTFLRYYAERRLVVI